jgi:hypothetical protein
MKRLGWRTASQRLLLLAVGVLVGASLFGGFEGPVARFGLGQQRVSAQPSGSYQGVVTRAAPFGRRSFSTSTTFAAPSDAQRSASKAFRERAAQAVDARVRRLPAADPRIASLPVDRAAVAAISAPMPKRGSPSPRADGDFLLIQLENLLAFAPSSPPITSPSVAENGKYVFLTWDGGAARSDFGGQFPVWTLVDPTQGGDVDLCCNQDVIYDKGRDSFFWLRTGDAFFPSPIGGTENRYVLMVGGSDATFTCGYEFRPSNLPLSGLTANTWVNEPRMSLSNNHLYLQYNLYDSTTNALVTHILKRFDLTELRGCGVLNVVHWNVSSVAVDGWRPALVENARETMFMGDHIVTNTGVNTGFRVYWVFDDSLTLSFVNKTIAPYLFTAPGAFGANCPVPGGANPCATSDIRVTGGTILHNSPLPAGLGASGDRVDFYWNVREGNGFTRPFVDAAGFHAGTLNYGSRKQLVFSNATPFFAAVGANDRDHVGLAALLFYDATTGIDPALLLGVDDNYDCVPPVWETYAFSGARWTHSEAGRSLRVRKHAPEGTTWIAGMYLGQGAGTYGPFYVTFGRQRDIEGFFRFFQR